MKCDNSILCKNIEELCKYKGISISAFERESGIPADSVSRLQEGKQYPKLRIVKSMADYFHVTIDELLYGDYKRLIGEQNAVAVFCRILKNKTDREEMPWNEKTPESFLADPDFPLTKQIRTGTGERQTVYNSLIYGDGGRDNLLGCLYSCETEEGCEVCISHILHHFPNGQSDEEAYELYMFSDGVCVMYSGSNTEDRSVLKDMKELYDTAEKSCRGPWISDEAWNAMQNLAKKGKSEHS